MKTSLRTAPWTAFLCAALFFADSPEFAEPRRGPFGSVRLRAGTEFKNYRFPWSFRLPRETRLNIRPRGVYRLAVLSSWKNEEYQILYTVFLLRYPERFREILPPGKAEKKSPNKKRGPCLLPEKIPPGDFKLTVSCVIRIAKNALKRRIIYERRGKRLQIFYLTYRSGLDKLADEIIGSIKENPAYYDPAR